MTRMRNRHAFTLLELVVSITVAGIIALLAYGSATAGFDTRDALARHRATSEAELRSRVLLADALRHASDESDVGHPAFDLVDSMDPRGLPADHLSFLSRGIGSPLGGSDLWSVTLVASPQGLIVRGVPVGAASSAAVVTAVLGRVRGIDVEVMSLADRTWSPTWASGGQLPAAVRLTLFDSSGAPVGAPLLVRIGLENIP